MHNITVFNRAVKLASLYMLICIALIVLHTCNTPAFAASTHNQPGASMPDHKIRYRCTCKNRPRWDVTADQPAAAMASLATCVCGRAGIPVRAGLAPAHSSQTHTRRPHAKS